MLLKKKAIYLGFSLFSTAILGSTVNQTAKAATTSPSVGSSTNNSGTTTDPYALPSNLSADTAVNFTDPNLEGEVKNALNIFTTTPITVGQIESYKGNNLNISMVEYDTITPNLGVTSPTGPGGYIPDIITTPIESLNGLQYLQMLPSSTKVQVQVVLANDEKADSNLAPLNNLNLSGLSIGGNFSDPTTKQIDISQLNNVNLSNANVLNFEGTTPTDGVNQNQLASIAKTLVNYANNNVQSAHTIIFNNSSISDFSPLAGTSTGAPTAISATTNTVSAPTTVYAMNNQALNFTSPKVIGLNGQDVANTFTFSPTVNGIYPPNGNLINDGNDNYTLNNPDYNAKNLTYGNFGYAGYDARNSAVNQQVGNATLAESTNIIQPVVFQANPSVTINYIDGSTNKVLQTKTVEGSSVGAAYDFTTEDQLPGYNLTSSTTLLQGSYTVNPQTINLTYAPITTVNTNPDTGSSSQTANTGSNTTTSGSSTNNNSGSITTGNSNSSTSSTTGNTSSNNTGTNVSGSTTGTNGSTSNTTSNPGSSSTSQTGNSGSTSNTGTSTSGSSSNMSGSSTSNTGAGSTTTNSGSSTTGSSSTSNTTSNTGSSSTSQTGNSGSTSNTGTSTSGSSSNMSGSSTSNTGSTTTNSGSSSTTRNSSTSNTTSNAGSSSTSQTGNSGSTPNTGTSTSGSSSNMSGSSTSNTGAGSTTTNSGTSSTTGSGSTSNPSTGTTNTTKPNTSGSTSNTDTGTSGSSSNMSGSSTSNTGTGSSTTNSGSSTTGSSSTSNAGSSSTSQTGNSGSTSNTSTGSTSTNTGTTDTTKPNTSSSTSNTGSSSTSNTGTSTSGSSSTTGTGSISNTTSNTGSSSTSQTGNSGSTSTPSTGTSGSSSNMSDGSTSNTGTGSTTNSGSSSTTGSSSTSNTTSNTGSSSTSQTGNSGSTSSTGTGTNTHTGTSSTTGNGSTSSSTSNGSTSISQPGTSGSTSNTSSTSTKPDTSGSSSTSSGSSTSNTGTSGSSNMGGTSTSNTGSTTSTQTNGGTTSGTQTNTSTGTSHSTTTSNASTGSTSPNTGSTSNNSNSTTGSSTTNGSTNGSGTTNSGTSTTTNNGSGSTTVNTNTSNNTTNPNDPYALPSNLTDATIVNVGDQNLANSIKYALNIPLSNNLTVGDIKNYTGSNLDLSMTLYDLAHPNGPDSTAIPGASLSDQQSTPLETLNGLQYLQLLPSKTTVSFQAMLASDPKADTDLRPLDNLNLDGVKIDGDFSDPSQKEIDVSQISDLNLSKANTLSFEGSTTNDGINQSELNQLAPTINKFANNGQSSHMIGFSNSLINDFSPLKPSETGQGVFIDAVSNTVNDSTPVFAVDQQPVTFTSPQVLDPDGKDLANTFTYSTTVPAANLADGNLTHNTGDTYTLNNFDDTAKTLSYGNYGFSNGYSANSAVLEHLGNAIFEVSTTVNQPLITQAHPTVTINFLDNSGKPIIVNGVAQTKTLAGNKIGDPYNLTQISQLNGYTLTSPLTLLTGNFSQNPQTVNLTYAAIATQGSTTGNVNSGSQTTTPNTNSNGNTGVIVSNDTGNKPSETNPNDQNVNVHYLDPNSKDDAYLVSVGVKGTAVINGKHFYLLNNGEYVEASQYIGIESTEHGIVRTFGFDVEMYNRQGEAINIALLPNTAWKFSRIVKIVGQSYYQIAVDKFIKIDNGVVFVFNPLNTDVNVTVKTNTFNSQGQKVSEVLPVCSAWRSDGWAIINGVKMYRVASNQYVEDSKVDTYTPVETTYTTQQNTPLYNARGQLLRKSLPANSSWDVDRLTDINGQRFYRVASNQYVKLD